MRPHNYYSFEWCVQRPERSIQFLSCVGDIRAQLNRDIFLLPVDVVSPLLPVTTIHRQLHSANANGEQFVSSQGGRRVYTILMLVMAKTRIALIGNAKATFQAVDLLGTDKG